MVDSTTSSIGNKVISWPYSFIDNTQPSDIVIGDVRDTRTILYQIDANGEGHAEPQPSDITIYREKCFKPEGGKKGELIGSDSGLFKPNLAELDKAGASH